MKQVIRKTNIDVIHIYYGDDQALWTVMKSYSSNKPVTYFLINEYNSNNRSVHPVMVTREELIEMFDHDVVSLFDEK